MMTIVGNASQLLKNVARGNEPDIAPPISSHGNELTPFDVMLKEILFPLRVKKVITGEFVVVHPRPNQSSCSHWCFCATASPGYIRRLGSSASGGFEGALVFGS